MDYFLIRYRVRPNKAAEQAAAVREFVAAIAADAEAQIGYTVYRADETAFVHLAEVADAETLARLQSRPYFKAFAEGMRPRCEAPPEVTKLARFLSTSG